MEVHNRLMYSHRMARISLIAGMIFGFMMQLVSASWEPFVVGMWITCLFFYSMRVGNPESLPESATDGSVDFLMGFGSMQFLALGWEWIRL
jgi:hypothetical protein